MPFTGEEDHYISLNEAAELTARYREAAGGDAKLGGFFGKATLLRILGQEDCVGIRYYYGLDSEDKPVLVLAGADAEENDQIDGELAELSLPCPHMCGEANSLNGGI